MSRPIPKHHYRTCFFDHPGVPGIEKVKDGGWVFGYTGAVHKIGDRDSKYCVANEMICASIGTYLMLPIPPFAVTHSVDGRYFFSSLDFNFDREQLPPIMPDLCGRELKNECAGIVLFDILIANEDRHDKNLAVDEVSKPTAIRAFDHGNALLGGGGNSMGIPRINELIFRLGITGGSVTGGRTHCLLMQIDDPKYFTPWLHRIDSIPEWYIDNACEVALPYGLSRKESSEIKTFLKYRAHNMRELMQKHKTAFTEITDKKWNAFWSSLQ